MNYEGVCRTAPATKSLLNIKKTSETMVRWPLDLWVVALPGLLVIAGRHRAEEVPGVDRHLGGSQSWRSKASELELQQDLEIYLQLVKPQLQRCRRQG